MNQGREQGILGLIETIDAKAQKAAAVVDELIGSKPLDTHLGNEKPTSIIRHIQERLGVLDSRVQYILEQVLEIRERA